MANIVGDITFGVGADTKGLDRSLDRLRAFGRTVDHIAAAQVGASQSVTRAYNAQEKAMRSAVGKAAEMQRVIRSSSAGSTQQGQMLGQVTNSLNAYTRALSSGQINSVQFTRATDRFNISMGKLKNNLQGFKPPVEQGSKFANVLKDLSSTAILASGPLGGLSSRFAALNSITSRSTVVMAGFLAGAAGVTIGIGKLASGAINASMELGRINAAFLAATGSTVAASKEFDYTKDVANKLGLDLKTTASSYSQLTAASRGTRLEGKATRDIFEAAAMASTALRLSSDDTTGILKALTQMMSKGTIQAEELRGQLGDRMPGAFNLMADALGVTTQQLGDMMKKGEVLSEDALPKLARQMALVYGGPAAVQAEQLQASINRMTTAQLMFNKAFDDATGVSDKYKAVIDGVTGLLNSFTKNIENIIGVLIAFTGGIVGAGTAFAVTFAASRWTAAVALITSARKAMLLFNLALMANPVVLAATAAALLGAVVAYKSYAKGIQEANITKTNATIETANEFVNSQSRMKTASKEMTDAYIKDVEDQLAASMSQIGNLDKNLIALEKRAAEGRVLSSGKDVFDKRLEASRKAYNEEGQRIITMQGLLKKLQKTREGAKDPSDAPTMSAGNDNSKPKLDKFQEAADDLEVIRARTAAINALPDYWLSGTKSLDAFNKSLNNGKQLEAYHDKLVLAGASSEVVAQKMREMTEALEQSDAAEMKLKRIEERAKELEQWGGSALDTFGGFLEKLGDDSANVAEDFDDMVTSIIGSLRKLVIQQTILDPLKEVLFGTTGGSGSGGGLWGALSSAIGAGIGGMFGGGNYSYNPATTAPPPKPTLSGYRANGGPVMRGRAYMVGEKGPEPFIPGTSGSIIPNGAMGGTTVNVTVINNSNAQVTTKQSNGGKDLEVMIDNLIAKKLGDPSSQSSKAVRNSRPMMAGR